MKITLSNLPETVTQNDLMAAAEEFGKVVHLMIVKDVETSKPTGLAWLEMGTRSEGEAAIAGLEGREIGGNKISARESHDETSSNQGKNLFKGGSAHANKGPSGSKFGGGQGKGGRVLKGGGGAQRGR